MKMAACKKQPGDFTLNSRNLRISEFFCFYLFVYLLDKDDSKLRHAHIKKGGCLIIIVQSMNNRLQNSILFHLPF